ncbi:phBC6A51 family helix-turn-helix protein [Dysgonomonas termitidis]|uniref:PhBC6A51 family helix-turn-helix protein n=1 Tax=Dysgonomonas termitidis TaxID=1516126 RepID=A0ABV9KT32_9BACT
MAKYSEESVEKIVSLIEDDFCSVAEICRVMGISRKTFYSWKDTKPELAREIAKAEDQREERTRQMLYSSLKKRLDGYIMVEEKEIYLPDARNPEGVSLQSKTIKRKNCLPDLRTIKLLLDRQDKKSSSRTHQEMEKAGKEYMTEIEPESLYMPEEPEIDPVCITAEAPHVEDDMEQATAENDDEGTGEIDEAEMNEYFERMDKAFAARQEIKRKLTANNNRKTVSQQNKRKKKRRK